MTLDSNETSQQAPGSAKTPKCQVAFRIWLGRYALNVCMGQLHVHAVLDSNIWGISSVAASVKEVCSWEAVVLVLASASSHFQSAEAHADGGQARNA